MDHLAAKDLPCPTPVRFHDGGNLGELAGRPAALITFRDGMWIRRPQVVHCGELGAALAAMHLAGLDFDGTRRNALACDDWPGLFAQCREHADDVYPGLAAEVERALDRLTANWPADLPQGVIHADLFPDNVFFIGDTLSGIIDFYFACTEAIAYDVAICLNAWCFEIDGSFNITKARALLTAYGRVRHLSEPEIEALPLLAQGSAMRFLLTRLYDWVNTPADALVKRKDPLEYLKKLRFHGSVTSASEYGIDT